MSVQTHTFSGESAPGDFSAYESTRRPRTDEGVFYVAEKTQQESVSQLIEVSEKYSEARIDRNGSQLHRYRLEFSDGVKLNANMYKPARPINKTLVVQTPAWSTGSRGHNQATQRKLAYAGYSSLLVGHVGEERDTARQEIASFISDPNRTVDELRAISLEKQSHHMLQAAEYFTNILDLNTSEINVFGESRGAMTGLGILACAQSYGISVRKAMLVAPCFETGIGKEVMREVASQIPLELINMVRTIGKVSFQRLIRYTSTINISPKSFVYEAAHASTLFNGDAGRFVKDIPQLQDIMILAFDNDLAGQRSRWRRAFSEFPNVVIQSAPGAHISGIVDRRTVALTEDYLAGTARKLRSVR